MTALVWIGQFILFFLVWRIFIYIGKWILQTLPKSMWSHLIMNVIYGIVLVIVVHCVSETWWLVACIGALVGLFTARATLKE